MIYSVLRRRVRGRTLFVPNVDDPGPTSGKILVAIHDYGSLFAFTFPWHISLYVS
jgi:hypothetical protein